MISKGFEEPCARNENEYTFLTINHNITPGIDTEASDPAFSGLLSLFAQLQTVGLCLLEEVERKSILFFSCEP